MRFEVAGEPVAMGICPCESCRRSAAAPVIRDGVVELKYFPKLMGGTGDVPELAERGENGPPNRVARPSPASLYFFP